MTALTDLRGRLLDADTHEMVPAQMWGQVFGPASAQIAPIFLQMPEGAPDSFNVAVAADDTPINSHTVWNIKNGKAPGAIDPRRRAEVMDLMGVERQLLFSSGVGITGSFFASRPSEFDLAFVFHLDAKSRDWEAFGHDLIREHNDWAIRTASLNPRVRPVAFLSTVSLDDALNEARRAVSGGVRAVHIASAVPPGGMSPADPRLDDFWNYFASNDIVVTLHVGGEYTFLRSQVWEDAPIFHNTGFISAEVLPNPYRFSTIHMPAQNFLTAMILGGVFERHPRLRFGAIELGAHWVGPMAENLTQWVKWFRRRYQGFLSLSPHEYLNRNVRVTPYYFEPVRTYLQRYGLEDVYCFSSDWPHFEGGTDPKGAFAEQIEPLGGAIVEKFFRTNAELLLPG